MNTVMDNRNRNYGIDLLRGIAMFFVICQHIIGQGGLLENAVMGSGKFWVLSFAQILVYCAVNIYGITTGYLLCRKAFQLNRVVKIWMTTVFWSVAVSCCFFALVPESRTVEEAVSMFLPILRGRYWFFTAYFVVMLVSPALNVLIHSMSRRQFHLLFAALFVIFGIVPVGALGNDVLRISEGHHFSWMVILYLIGGYLRLHGEQITTKLGKNRSGMWLAGYFLFAAAHLLYKFVVVQIGLEGLSWLLLTYPSPLILGEAVCLFLYFCGTGKRISGGSALGKLIRFAAPGVYSVYVIHVHPKVFWNENIIGLFRAWDSWNVLTVCVAMIGTAAALFTVCVCLDAVRQWLFRSCGIDRMVTNISDWMETKVRNLLADTPMI